jgi:predicted alpha/beta-hydrolase family hydrolase
MPDRIRIDVSDDDHVTAISYPPTGEVRHAAILGHGAGAGQTSPFMVHAATALAARGVHAITFNFLYTEQGKRLPDRNDKLEACYRAVIGAYYERGFAGPVHALAIGGKSMGGRIASQVAAADSRGIAGVVMLGYPLHPPGRPDKPRTKHLPAIKVPMLFVQGSRDAFGTPDELRPVMKHLTAPATLYVVEGGDHSFKVPKKGPVPQDQVYDRVFDEIVNWVHPLKASGW